MNYASSLAEGFTLSANDQQYGEGHDAIIRLIDATDCIMCIGNMNGPSGRMLGRSVEEYLLKSGKQLGDLTISELGQLCEKNREEYNALYRRIHRT